MKKITIFSLLSIIFISSSISKPVDYTTAKSVGENFLKTRVASNKLNQNLTLDLVYTYASRIVIKDTATQYLNYFFVFNINNDSGYVIISADDIVFPVLAYSDVKGFDPNKIPINVKNWLDGYKNEIHYAVMNSFNATNEITKEWGDLLKGNFGKQKLNKKGSVSPLLKTKWDQLTYYNSLCPYDNSAKENAATGCVATAMAQVMKFWNYPSTGTGSYSYYHSKYGSIAANFGNTQYNWSAMPNSVTSSNTSVATLIYHCGVSLNMDYDLAKYGGSGARTISSKSELKNCLEYSLKKYFRYKTSLKGIERKNYKESEWINIMKAELDAGRPVIYSGTNDNVGHCFVADGYDNNDYLHFNWGWSGAYDGYFHVSSLNPSGTGTGGGSGEYNKNQDAIIGIQPLPDITNDLLDITSNVTPSSMNINYGNAFTITTNITNKSSSTFKGTYYAAIFDKENKFVANIDSLIDSTGLAANNTYKNNLVFRFKGSLTLLTGSYTVGIFYKISGGVKTQIYSSGNYYYFTEIYIIHDNEVELCSNITLNPSEFRQGQSAWVGLNIVNKGENFYFGKYQVNLYNMDGSFAETIATIVEKNGLDPNHSYASNLKFATDEIISEPGNYFLAVVSKSDTSSKWIFLGSLEFQNPIIIKLGDPVNLKDKYEVNNTLNQAFTLPLEFTNNIAKTNTNDANCHIRIDNDYYKIELPSGYNYTIKAELFDINNDKGKGYSIDGIVSYALDTINFSIIYENKIPYDIKVNNGGTSYFYVIPSYDGEHKVGTYSLDIQVTRSPILTSAKNITSFSVEGMVGAALIDTVGATVKINVNSSTNIASLNPNITISNFASITPSSNTTVDFTNPVNYTVIAQDNSKKIWKVTITKLPYLSASKNITGFKVNGIIGNAIIDTVEATIKLKVNASINITSLIPTISISNLATITPKSNVARDFTNPVNYTITSQDNSTKIWTITITKENASVDDRFVFSNLIKVYPNPSKDFIEVELLGLQLEDIKIKISDLHGEINSYDLIYKGNGKYKLNTSILKNGIYCLQLETNKGIVNKRFVVAK